MRLMLGGRVKNWKADDGCGVLMMFGLEALLVAGIVVELDVLRLGAYGIVDYSGMMEIRM